MDNIEKIRKFVKELQQDFISIQPKDCSLEWLEHAKTVYNIRGANAFELLTLQMIIEHINEM